ncbi:MAG: MBL fold metallo-hydrolase [Candidatus Lokiarchaeota archaeon]|nr:MBL fold metallo-hydrolase [Candidatus Lokiarchaeota archaeon]
MEAPAVRDVAPGIVVVNEEDQICATWILHQGRSCFVVEMPPKAVDGYTIPAELVLRCIEERGLTPVGLVFSHAHWDHIDGVATYWDALTDFPEMKLICHESAIEIAPKLKTFFDTVFSDDAYETNIEGEPLYLIHAPKHSASDLMIVFRGTMLTGDWWLGWGDPNPGKVPPATSIKSVDRILGFLRNHRYVVTRLFSVHANDFRYDVNAEAILLETRRYHEMKLAQEKG